MPKKKSGESPIVFALCDFCPCYNVAITQGSYCRLGALSYHVLMQQMKGLPRRLTPVSRDCTLKTVHTSTGRVYRTWYAKCHLSKDGNHYIRESERGGWEDDR